MQSASYLHVTDERRDWEPALRAQDWDLHLGDSPLEIRLEFSSKVQATIPANTKRHYVGVGRAVMGPDVTQVLPWLMRHRSISCRPLIFLLATPQMAPWFPLWWEAGATWIATEKHQVKSLVQLVTRTARRRPPVAAENLLWHEIEVGQLPWHDEI